MKAQLIKIGNSKGVRLPKSVIEQCGLKNEIEIKIKDKKIVISSSQKARIGWEGEFERLTQNGRIKDEIVFENPSSESDDREWIW